MNKNIMIAIAAVIVLGIGVFWFMGGEDDSSSETNNNTESSQVDNTNEEAQASTIVELAQNTETLSTLVSAVVQAELVDTLNSEGPFTVLAPTNDAFADLLTALNVTAPELLSRDDLGDILTYHVIAGAVESSALTDGMEVETVLGETLTVSIDDSGVSFIDANGGVAMVTAADIEASNGVVHLIDAVLLP